MRAYVGVTDGDWYRYLSARPLLDEVNFWRPSGGRGFRALAPGELFFFKTHHPHHRVVGGGFYCDFAQLSVSEAWDVFGEANGVASLDEMRRRIGRYQRQPVATDPVIGCIVVRDVRFFEPESLPHPPPDFAPNVVQGKTYDLVEPAVREHFRELLARMQVGTDLDSAPWRRAGPVYGNPRLARYRLGQCAFQVAVLRAYDRRCAITGNKIRPVLQAAHILPLPVGGEHRVDNGLLLRSDVHTMFDRGYLGVDAGYRLLVSPRLRDEFGDGEQFHALEGEVIGLPQRPVDRPHPKFLEWHLGNVFKAH